MLKNALHSEVFSNTGSESTTTTNVDKSILLSCQIAKNGDLILFNVRVTFGQITHVNRMNNYFLQFEISGH